MICCQFIFQPGEYDEDFDRLDGQIDAFARSLPGFVRVETWVSRDTRIVNACYFFADAASVRELARFPEHRQAKAQSKRWYDRYRIVMTEVTAEYGDLALRPV